MTSSSINITFPWTPQDIYQGAGLWQSYNEKDQYSLYFGRPLISRIIWNGDGKDKNQHGASPKHEFILGKIIPCLNVLCNCSQLPSPLAKWMVLAEVVNQLIHRHSSDQKWAYLSQLAQLGGGNCISGKIYILSTRRIMKKWKHFDRICLMEVHTAGY